MRAAARLAPSPAPPAPAPSPGGLPRSGTAPPRDSLARPRSPAGPGPGPGQGAPAGARRRPPPADPRRGPWSPPAPPSRGAPSRPRRGRGGLLYGVRPRRGPADGGRAGLRPSAAPPAAGAGRGHPLCGQARRPPPREDEGGAERGQDQHQGGGAGPPRLAARARPPGDQHRTTPSRRRDGALVLRSGLESRHPLKSTCHSTPLPPPRPCPPSSMPRSWRPQRCGASLSAGQRARMAAVPRPLGRWGAPPGRPTPRVPHGHPGLLPGHHAPGYPRTSDVQQGILLGRPPARLSGGRQ